MNWAAHQRKESRLIGFPTPKSRLGRLFSAIRAFVIVLRIKPSIVHFHDPELITVAWLLRVAGCKVIYDVHEDYPNLIRHKIWIPAPLRLPAAWSTRLLEMLFARMFATRIVAVTDHIAKRFPVAKSLVVQNFPLQDEIKPLRIAEKKSECSEYVYLGCITMNRCCMEMIKAIELMKERGHDCQLNLFGRTDAATHPICVALNEKETSASYLGIVPLEQVPAYLSSASASLVLMYPTPNHVHAQPNKLFEAMSAGIPVIASDFPAWREIIEPLQCGLLVDPMSPVKISEAMIWIMEHPKEAHDMGMRGRKAVEQTYNWQHESVALLRMYHELDDSCHEAGAA